MNSINSSKVNSIEPNEATPNRFLPTSPYFSMIFFKFLILYLALRSAGGGGQNVISRQWENGKPVGDYNWGSKPREA